jgi:TATA-binding protein-associated factor
VKVVAPVRETVSQTLASLLIHMPRRSLRHVHSVLLQMIRQNFAVPADTKTKNDVERSHVWEVRHAGLLGIKYEVAVRNDMFDQPSIKQEDKSIDGDQNVLRGVVGAAILGCVGSLP